MVLVYGLRLLRLKTDGLAFAVPLYSDYFELQLDQVFEIFESIAAFELMPQALPGGHSLVASLTSDL